MSHIRVNLTLDEDVWEKFDELVPKRKKSVTINKLLKDEIERIKCIRAEQALAAAFREASEDPERSQVLQEWASLDSEGWGDQP